MILVRCLGRKGKGAGRAGVAKVVVVVAVVVVTAAAEVAAEAAVGEFFNLSIFCLVLTTLGRSDSVTFLSSSRTICRRVRMFHLNVKEQGKRVEGECV